MAEDDDIKLSKEQVDMGLGGSSGRFQPGKSCNTDFGKNVHGAAQKMIAVIPSGQFVQASFAQGGLRRNNSDVESWQISGVQKCLIPPHVIHKTNNRYEAGKVSNEEELKQRQIKYILNKLTPQNFEKIFLQVKEVNIDSAVCLKGVISQIFDKALMEPIFCEMYAKFCVQLAAGLPRFYEDNERVMFRRVLLNKCQEEFERNEREQAEDGEIKLSKEEREEKRAAQRRRKLVNVQFIGELYKKSMLTERIMHECIEKLLGEYQKADEENVEYLCKLMCTIGHMIDHPKAKEHIDAYFERITKMANNQALPTQLRFMLKDVIDLRKNRWQFEQASFAQGGLRRSNSDVERWQISGVQKCSIPPHVIHKTDNRYKAGKVSNGEELKQRQIKSILNKLTPQNFNTLFLQVKVVNIDSAVCLTGVISQIFERALMEPTFCEMYAKFCVCLAVGLPEFYEDNERVMFRRVLLNKCQQEFERDDREQAVAEMAEDGGIKLSKGERDEKRDAQQRRKLGNIQFIGELYKESMLTERVMHEYIKKLLDEYQKPDEENVESLCKLMSTIGYMIDHPKAKEHFDAYFEKMTKMANNQALPAKLRFMLKDVIDLRKNGWQQRRKADGPKKIEEVHRDAAQERQQALGGRLNRAPRMGHYWQRISTPPDHGSRGP